MGGCLLDCIVGSGVRNRSQKIQKSGCHCLWSLEALSVASVPLSQANVYNQRLCFNKLRGNISLHSFGAQLVTGLGFGVSQHGFTSQFYHLEAL